MLPSVRGLPSGSPLAGPLGVRPAVSRVSALQSRSLGSHSGPAGGWGGAAGAVKPEGTGGAGGGCSYVPLSSWWAIGVIPILFAKVAVSDLQPSLHS